MTESNLNRHDDRCDRCGSQAFYRVWVPLTNVDTVDDIMAPEKPLLFCGHHAGKLEALFESRGWRTEDFRDQINVKPSVSANAE